MPLLVGLTDKSRTLRKTTEDNVSEPGRQASRAQLLRGPVALDMPALLRAAAVVHRYRRARDDSWAGIRAALAAPAEVRVGGHHSPKALRQCQVQAKSAAAASVCTGCITDQDPSTDQNRFVTWTRLAGMLPAGGGARSISGGGSLASYSRVIERHSIESSPDGHRAQRKWIVAGERVGLTAIVREEFVARWDAYNDPELAMLLMYPTAQRASAFSKPPVTREQREAVWEGISQSPSIAAFDIRMVEDQRFVGEGSLGRITWPSASAEIAVAIFDPEDRGCGCGSEAAILMAAYAFDALALHRVTLRYLAMNDAVARGVEREAEAVGARIVGVERESEWAYGAWQDTVLVELLARNFPPHPATAALRSESMGAPIG